MSAKDPESLGALQSRLGPLAGARKFRDLVAGIRNRYPEEHNQYRRIGEQLEGIDAMIERMEKKK